MNDSGGHTLSSPLFEDMWSSSEMRHVFSDTETVECWIRVETQIALAQGELGLIPKESAAQIAQCGNLADFDLDRMRTEIKLSAHPLTPFLTQYRELCGPQHGQYVHWGATTQDVLDTAAVLQWKNGTDIILGLDLDICVKLASLAKAESTTVMAARTQHQQAAPFSFGFKVATWLDEISRGIERIRTLYSRAFCINIGGAVGTFAYMGELGPKVAENVAENLELHVPPMPWQSARDRVVEVVTSLAMLGGSFGRLGHETALLQKTEIGEIEEPHLPGEVGSSTMPQKLNPNLSETIVSASLSMQGCVSTAYALMGTEHERDDSRWQVEFRLVPEVFLLLDRQARNVQALLGGVVVNSARMRQNISAATLAEGVVRSLGEHIGRQNAYDCVKRVATLAAASGNEFATLLAEDAVVSEYLSADALEELLAAETYIGLSGTLANALSEKVLDEVHGPDRLS